MESVTMEPLVIFGKCRAIICFGPASSTTGFRSGEYYQVTIDPEMVSPGGDYIRFDQRRTSAENEVHGWQRIDALTICEVLSKGEADPLGHTVTMRSITKE